MTCTTLSEGTIKRIHVNQFVIRKKGDHPLRVKTSSANLPASEVKIQGPSSLVYRPEKPLSCGAKLWIETLSEVVVTT